MGLTIFFVIMFCSFFCVTLLWLSFDGCILCQIWQPCFAILYVILWFIFYKICDFMISHEVNRNLERKLCYGGDLDRTKTASCVGIFFLLCSVNDLPRLNQRGCIWETLLILRMSWQILEWNEEKIYDDIGWFSYKIHRFSWYFGTQNEVKVWHESSGILLSLFLQENMWKILCKTL